MTQAEKIKSNAQTHGIQWAAKQARKQGVNISTIRFVLFGKY